MKIRFGYVAISKKLNKITPNGTITYTNYQKITDEFLQKDKLISVTNKNIEALFYLLKYNNKNDIHFFRITSSLIPLATHPKVLWDFSIFNNKLNVIGNYIKKVSMRVDMHPDQFNVLNSVKEEVVSNTIRNLEYHHQILKYMGLNEEKLIIHVGSSTEGKEKAKMRFINNFKLLPIHIKERLVIENDDKIFNALDVIEISNELKIPFVFDYHHHKCNYINDVEKLSYRIFTSWENSKFIPKVHLSSPKLSDFDRRHADFINIYDFYSLLNIFKDLNYDFDIMIEAKMKDLALYKLIADIKKDNPDWNFINKTTLEL